MIERYNPYAHGDVEQAAGSAWRLVDASANKARPEVHPALRCCERAEVLPCVCAFARHCPEHGNQHCGSHD
jgi:hypothetical protein